MKKTLGLILSLLVIVWGATTLGVGPAPIIGVAWADQHGENEEKDKADTESGPSLDALDSAIESSTGAEGNFRLPEGGGGAAAGGGEGGSVLDRLRGRLGAVPKPAVRGGGGTPDLPPVDVGGADVGSGDGTLGPSKVLLQIQSPETVAFGGPAPTPCSPAALPAQSRPPVSSPGVVKGPGLQYRKLATKSVARSITAPVSAVGQNRAVICVTASTFNLKGKIEITNAPHRNLQRVSYSVGNPTDAIYVFNVPGPGTYKFFFQAALGREIAGDSIEIKVEKYVPEETAAGDGGGGSPGAKPEPKPNEKPSLTLTMLDSSSNQPRFKPLTVLATATDPDDKTVCIFLAPTNKVLMTNAKKTCGSNLGVDYTFKLSIQPVLDDYQAPSCVRRVLTVIAQDSRGARVAETMVIGIAGSWNKSVTPQSCYDAGYRYYFVGCVFKIDSC